MVDVSQIQDDLRFVRQTIDKRQVQPLVGAPYYVWAVYVFVGFLLADFKPSYSNSFFLIAFIPALILSGLVVRRVKAHMGELDATFHRRLMWHYLGGCTLAVIATAALANLNPEFNKGLASAQISLVLIGMVYFLAGIHIDRTLAFVGPLMMAGGIFLGHIPHYPFTVMGVIVGGGLCVAGLVATKARTSAADRPAPQA